MRCPYCTTEISQEAVVCPQCTRDLYLFKPLLEKIDRLETSIAEQAKSLATAYEVRIATLEATLATQKGVPIAGAQLIANPHPAAPSDSPPAVPEPPPRGYPASVLLALVPVLVLLVAAHGLLLIVFDLKPLYLRIASILIPLPFGFALLVWYPKRLWMSTLAGFAMATVAVYLMVLATARIDHVPVLPQDAREVREFIEYVASIGLAFLTGLLLGKWRYWIRRFAPRPSRLAVLLAQLFARNEEGEFGIERMAKRIQKLQAAVTPAATAAASLYAGVKALIDNSG